MQTLHHRYLSIVLCRCCCVSYTVGNTNTSKPKVSNNRNFSTSKWLFFWWHTLKESVQQISREIAQRGLLLWMEFRAPSTSTIIINYHTLQSLSTVGCLSKRECQSKSRPQNLKTKFDKNHAASSHCFPSVNVVHIKCYKIKIFLREYEQ